MIQQTNTIWAKILLVLSVIFFIFGLDMAFMGLLYPDVIALLFDLFGGNNYLLLDPTVQNFISWSLGISGAILAGWAIILGYLSYLLTKKDETWIWNVIFVSLFAWFIPDMIVSIFYGVTFNIISNIIIVDLLLIPFVGRFISNRKLTNRNLSTS